MTDWANRKEEILQTYKDLHELAEPSWEEKSTSEFIIRRLKEAGLNPRTFSGHYGVIVDIPGQNSEVVALRADMDALVQEVDGEVRANHSCGHDAHSTMVLHTALAIAQKKHSYQRTLRFIFQPAEEKGEGALQMLQEGALQDVRYLFGIHLRPWMEVPNGKASPVIIHGSALTMIGRIKGKPSHASRPQDGRNPIEAASALIQAIGNIRLQNSPFFSVKMTQLRSGEGATNQIPETASFALDLRAQSNEAMTELKLKTEHVLTQVAQLTETEIEWESQEFVPAAQPNDEAMELAKKAIIQTLGDEQLVPVCQSNGSEDFHFYTLNQPSVKATMIGLGCDLRPGLHHPQMKFDLQALWSGTILLTNLVLQAAEEAKP